ncbi:MAG: trigger factor, partial [bacterium]
DLSLEPIDYPKVKVVQDGKLKPLIYSVEVSLYPEFKLPIYKGIKIEKKSCAVAETEIDTALQNLKDSYANYEDAANRGTKTGDLVKLDMEASLDSNQIAGLTKKDVNIVIGDSHIAPAFDHEVAGLDLNQEKTFAVDFGADSPIKEVAGKKVDFKVVVKKVCEKKLPEINEEFIRNMNIPGVTDIAGLREEIRKSIVKHKEEDVNAEMRDKLLDKIVEGMKVEVPQPLIKREIDLMKEEMRISLERSRMDMNTYLKSTGKTEEAIEKEFQPTAAKRAKAKMLLRQVAKEESITVSSVDIDLELKSIAEQSNRTIEAVEVSLGEGYGDYITDYLLRRKTIDFLVSVAKVS